MLLAEDAKRLMLIDHNPNARIARGAGELSRLDVGDQAAAAIDLSDFALNRTWHNAIPQLVPTICAVLDKQPPTS